MLELSQRRKIATDLLLIVISDSKQITCFAVCSSKTGLTSARVCVAPILTSAIFTWLRGTVIDV